MQKVIETLDGWKCIVLEELDKGYVVDWRFVGGDKEPTRFFSFVDCKHIGFYSKATGFIKK